MNLEDILNETTKISQDISASIDVVNIFNISSNKRWMHI